MLYSIDHESEVDAMSTHEIAHSIERFFDAPIFKVTVTFVGSVLQYLYGPPDAAIKAFLALMVLDFVTGIVKAEIRGEATSYKSRKKGAQKYIAYGVVLMMCHFLDQAVVPGLRNVSLFWASATEARSIVENLELMGVPMPDFIKEHLHRADQSHYGIDRLEIQNNQNNNESEENEDESTRLH